MTLVLFYMASFSCQNYLILGTALPFQARPCHGSLFHEKWEPESDSHTPREYKEITAVELLMLHAGHFLQLGSKNVKKKHCRFEPKTHLSFIDYRH